MNSKPPDSSVWRCLAGDAVEMLKTVPDGIARCCVTSPPYFGLRDYGVDGQIGLEKTPEEYVEKMVGVFREVRRTLSDDGTLWLNIGDSYKDKELIGIPWMLAFALRADGWFLRQDIIWSKPNPMPESVKDRCTKSHEYVFLLSKSAKYFFDAKAIEEASVTKDNRRPYGSKGAWELDGRPESKRPNGKPRTNGGASFGKQSHDATGTGQQSRTYERPAYETRNARSVWRIATKSYRGAHFAVMPEALALRSIKAGSREGDVVIDPFAGSGTTLKVAVEMGRRAIGVELSQAYIDGPLAKRMKEVEYNLFTGDRA